MQPTTLEMVAAVLFGAAVIHTFSVKRIEVAAHALPEGSIGRNVLELLGEVEVVFGLWAGILVTAAAVLVNPGFAIDYLEGKAKGYGVNFTEPAFVFAIMTMAATRPIIGLATGMISKVAQTLPLPRAVAFFGVTLVLGPLLGGLITGPAAMTVTALILKRRYFDHGMSERFKYATIGTLFVNVSIGGTLTNFAAPPVLMVARKWDWDISFMLLNFGWKAALAVMINAVTLTLVFRKEIASMVGAGESETDSDPRPLPAWLILAHMLLMAGVVYHSHHMVVFLGFFLFFLGVVDVTQEFQEELALREALLVAFFLGGLVVLGSMQGWWLGPLIRRLDSAALFFGAAGLTAVTDNAALTYLGSLVEGISDADKYALVAGAVAGGGLTVIANAPNPAGYGILKHNFGENGISPLSLLLAAAPPTAVVLAAFWLL